MSIPFTSGPAGDDAPSALPGELTHTTAPVPTRRTVRQRTSVPVQAFRFAAVSLKMLVIIGRSHRQ